MPPAYNNQAPQTDLREELAQDRTALASERTFASWTRTGLAFLAAGLGIAKFVDSSASLPLIRIMALLLILLAILSFVLGAVRYTALCKKLKRLDIALIPHQIILLISGTLVACSVIGLFAIWIMTGVPSISP